MKRTPRKEGRGHMLKGHINLSTVYTYLKNGQYPPGLSDCDKRAVRKRAKSFCLSDDELYFIEQPKKGSTEEPEGGQPITLRKVLTSEQERRKTVLEAHIDPEGIHYGIEKTTTAVNSRYYWVGISTIVRDIIRNCAVCQASRSNVNTSITPSLSRIFGIKPDPDETVETEANTSIVSSTPLSLITQDMEPANYFWEKVELQILGPYQCGRRKLYVAVGLDIFSLWPEVTALVDKSSSSITHFLINLICRYGVMKSVILRENDGIKFGDVLIRSDLLSKVGVELSLENFHVSETNEVWEEIESSVSSLTDTHPDSWSQCLELCMLPHRVSRPQRAEYTPAFLAHGREFNLPMELSHQDTNSYIDVHMTADQRAESIQSLMGVYGGYGNLLRVAESYQKGPGMRRAPYVACVEPGYPCPVVKVASVTMTDEDAEMYKEKDYRSVPKNSVVKTVSVAPARPLERGQKRIVVVSLVDRPPRLKADETDVEEEAVVKMELDGSDVDDGALSTQDCDPDFMTSTPFTRRCHDMNESLVKSDRVTRRSGRRRSPSFTARKVDVDGDSDATEAVEKVCSSGSQNLGFGMDDLDAYYTALEQYKVKGKYPEGFTNYQKRVLRKISQSYFLLDNVLYYLQGARSKKKVVIKTAPQRFALVKRAHVMDTGVHLSRSKVIDRLDSWNVYWKGLTLDCEAYVRACSLCDHGKERPRPDHQVATKKEESSIGEDDPNMELDEIDDLPEDNYEEMIYYLKHQKYPPKSNKNLKGRLKRKSKYFKLIDDVLHFVSKEGSDETPRRVLLIEEEKTEAIREIHSLYHYGQNRTYNMLRKKYYWRRMNSDVMDYIKICNQCEPRTYSTDEELAKRRIHMSDRVSWFKDKIASQEFDVEAEGIVNSLMKTEQMETEEVEQVDDPDVAVVDISQPEPTDPVKKQDQAEVTGGAVIEIQVVEEDVDKASETDVRAENLPSADIESSDQMVVDHSERHAGSVINVKVYSNLGEHQALSAPCVVVETVEGQGAEESSQNKTVSVVVENQQPSISEVQSQSSVDKVILVSDTQDMVQQGLMTSPSSSTVISEQGIPVTAGQSVDASSSGSVQMVVVSSDQWNTPDLNMLNERVRMPYSCERVSVEQIQDQEQSVILSNVTKGAMSSGNALAELVKATVGDLATEESVEKVSETASAVASIPVADPPGVPDDQMEVEEAEEAGEDDEDYVPPEEEETLTEKDGTEEKTVVKPKRSSGSRTLNKFNCEICGKVVKGTVTFKIHMYKHTGVKPFCCEVCNKKFTNNKSLRIHMRKHTGDTPFLCNLCGKAFSRATSLRYHLKAHEEGGGVPVMCDLCGREFSTSNRLEKHRLAKHPVEAPVFQCAECSKVFTAQRSLKRHMVSHQGIRQFQCQICGRSFFRKEYLNSHLAQHPEACQVSDGTQKVTKPRPKKKQVVMNLDPATGLQVQSVVQVTGNQPEATQTSDSTAFVFPQESVQYEVECLTSESTLTEADLKAIHFLAQASIHGQF